MMKTAFVSLLYAGLAFSAAAADTLSLKVEGIAEGSAISPVFAYCAPEQQPGGNARPALSWENVPTAAESLALVMVDPDVPTDFTDAGKEGKTLPAEMKRQNFYHWLVFNIPAHVTRLPAGKGKAALHTGTQGVNDYAAFHKDMPATHFTGYDGPCPPWNDERLHHYHFQLHALDIPLLKPAKDATPSDIAALIAKHSIAKAEVTGTYTLNKDVKN